MFISTRKVFAALAIVSATLVPLTACSSSSDSTGSSDSTNKGLVQIPEGPGGQYSADQDQEWQEVTGNDPNVVDKSNKANERLLSASTEKCFSTPDDIAAGAYVLDPDADEAGAVFYVSGGFSELPTFMVQTTEKVVVDIPADSTFCIERTSVLAATADDISSLPNAKDVS